MIKKTEQLKNRYSIKIWSYPNFTEIFDPKLLPNEFIFIYENNYCVAVIKSSKLDTKSLLCVQIGLVHGFIYASLIESGKLMRIYSNVLFEN